MNSSSTYPVKQHDVIVVGETSEIESPLSSDELQEHDPVAENVGLLRGFSGGEVLGGNVPDRPTDSRRHVGVLVVHELGEAEVTHDSFKALVQQNVGGLHVAVNDLGIAVVMQVGETSGRSQRDPSPCFPFKRRIIWPTFCKFKRSE